MAGRVAANGWTLGGLLQSHRIATHGWCLGGTNQDRTGRLLDARTVAELRDARTAPRLLNARISGKKCLG